MEPHAGRFDLDIAALPAGGQLPAACRLVLIEEFPVWNEAHEPAGYENRYWPSYPGLPVEYFAREPQEVNTVVVIRKDHVRTGTYNTGAAAYTQEWHVTLINLESRTLIAQWTFTGGPPSSKVVTDGHPLAREGSTVGSDPDGVAEWIGQILSGGSQFVQ